MVEKRKNIQGNAKSINEGTGSRKIMLAASVMLVLLALAVVSWMLPKLLSKTGNENLMANNEQTSSGSTLANISVACKEYLISGSERYSYVYSISSDGANGTLDSQLARSGLGDAAYSRDVRFSTDESQPELNDTSMIVHMNLDADMKCLDASVKYSMAGNMTERATDCISITGIDRVNVCKDNLTFTGTTSTTVPAGTFQTSKYNGADGSLVYIADSVPLVIRYESNGTVMALVNYSGLTN